MVTPKTDIVQAVGRILRAKHDAPIIVDLVDKHDVFKNQFKKKKNYTGTQLLYTQTRKHQIHGFGIYLYGRA
jgi:PII-like signaling protein